MKSSDMKSGVVGAMALEVRRPVVEGAVVNATDALAKAAKAMMQEKIERTMVLLIVG